MNSQVGVLVNSLLLIVNLSAKYLSVIITHDGSRIPERPQPEHYQEGQDKSKK